MSKTSRAVIALSISLGLVAACGKGPAAPTVPHLSAGPGATATGDADRPNAVAGNAGAARRAELHAAAECIRAHGAPQYPDPLLTAAGYVYTDEVTLRGLSESQMTAIDTACHSLIVAAAFDLDDQGPPPPKVIAAGVKSAQCLRANGLPDYPDPTVDSHFTPGKGFSLVPRALPAAGKLDPTVRRALDACRALLDEEAALSSIGNLGDA